MFKSISRHLREGKEVRKAETVRGGLSMYQIDLAKVVPYEMSRRVYKKITNEFIDNCLNS